MTPRRVSIPLALLALLTCASIAFFIFFGKEFPPRMAVHFGIGGRPDGYMDRVKFIVLGSFLSLMLPTFIAAMVGVLPRILPSSMLNVPNKDYWTAPERRGHALDTMLWFGLWLACLVQAFLMVLFIGIYRVNLADPPMLNAVGLKVTFPAVMFAAGVVWWGAGLTRAFAIPRANLR